ncbi:hypothetical protein [Erwinia oleae]|uniref:hypothetical protein n=1 Tax=Erwinia oleae TaxID=796334 RepID=UPI0005511EEB|nr:hypothetical protein [Erwinia oleae]
MRELQLCEIDNVSGGSFFSSVGAMILGGLAGATTGMMKVGIAGGNTGGILGVGVIGALVGVVLGLSFGAIQGGMYGLVNDWDKTLELFNNLTEQWMDLLNNNPK